MDPHLPRLGASLITTVLALVVRQLTANRLIRRKLGQAVGLLVLYIVLYLSRLNGLLGAAAAQAVGTIEPLLLTFALALMAVALALNPWREDRVPDRFPSIVQDAMVIALFALGSALILQEKVFAASAVSAVVLGFALQDTLGNLFAGLAIQVERPFAVGHWIGVGHIEGMVAEVTWRATKIRTKADNFVVVPNNVISKENITNYSEPSTMSRFEVSLSADYDTPPNRVKEAILAAIAHEPDIVKTPAPYVYVGGFLDSGIGYHVFFWIGDFSVAEATKDRVRTAIYYAFRREGITFPYPVQVQYEYPPLPKPSPPPGRTVEQLLGQVSILAPLSPAQRAALCGVVRERLFAAGDAIVREKQAGSSMFVVRAGEAVVTVGPADTEVARFAPGDHFGEMSLLTGEARTATVRAVTDCVVLELTVEQFRELLLSEPGVVDRVSRVVASRRVELEQRRAESSLPVASPETESNFLARVRQFLHLS